MPQDSDDDLAAAQKEIAKAEADIADAESHLEATEAAVAEAAAELGVTEGDPLLDTGVRQAVAQVDDENPFGQLGRPMSRRGPYALGLTAGLGLATAYVLVQAIFAARQVLILVAVALFLSFGLNPAFEALSRRGLGRRSAIAVVFTGVILFFGGFVAAVAPPLVHQSTQLTTELPSYVDRLQQNEQIAKLDRRYHVLSKAKTAVSSQNFGDHLFGGIIGVGKVVLGVVFSLLTVLILTLYFASSLPAIKRLAYSLAPRSRRARFGVLTDEILNRVGGYVSGALLIALIAGTTSFIFLEIAGVPYALPLALVVAVTDLIPLIGATIGAVIACGVAFFDSFTIGLVAVAFFIVYQQVENYLIYPRIMSRSVDVHPAATIVAALIGGTLLGVVGALLAIPTAAAIQLVLQEIVIPRQNEH
ncbi:MAG: hypothetical protein QOG53_2492 [Frankiales bacterium]|nr:hypothetical protein [Frankiales bacterium]